MFSGSLVALVTPMKRDGSVDYAAWTRLLEFHIANGTNGIVVGGTTGESATLSEAELRELTQKACAQVAGRMAVIAGAGTSSTAYTVERVRWLSELPIDGVLIVTPAYVRPPQEGLYQHFAAVAAASRAPVILYNVPSRTAVDLLPATVARLSLVPNIVAVKEAVAQIDRVRELVSSVKQGFVVLSGDDATGREAMRAGAKGVITVTGNIAPRAMSDLAAAALRGDHDEAARIDSGLVALHRDLFVEVNPIAVKWALVRMGLIDGTLRLPLVELAPAHHETVLAAMRTAGVSS